MTLSLTIDRPLVPTNTLSERHLLVRLRAPGAPANALREPVSIAFVIDRSGSMQGRPIELACQAVSEAVPLLAPSDQVAVVLYETDVEVLHPLGPADPASTASLFEALEDVECGSMTNLSGGWLTGCEQVAPRVDDTNARVLLLTDGLANRGIVDAPELSLHAQELRSRGITTSTLGLGEGFEEELLQELATRGGGASYYLEDETRISRFVKAELEEALSVVIPDARLDVRCTHPAHMELVSQYPNTTHAEGMEIHLGDLVDKQELVLALRLEVPALSKDTEVRLKVSLTSATLEDESRPEADPGKPQVLVIDDDEDARIILEEMLEEAGYEVVTASSGAEGLRLAEALSPHLILLDLMMPGMSGHEVLNRLKGSPDLEEIPVVVLSFVGTDSQRHLEGAAAVLDKPASSQELGRIIARNLNEAGSQLLKVASERRLRAFLQDPESAEGEVALHTAPHEACDGQPTSMEVVREVAGLRAAQIRLDALRMNREDDLDGAARALNLLARTLEVGPEGKDSQIQELIISLRKDARRYGRWMSESDRKHHSQVSYTRIRSRREDGTSIRLLES